MAKKSIVPAVWQIPQEFRDRLGEQAGRQRAMFADGHLLLILHAPPDPDDDERKGRFFWRQPDGTWSSDGDIKSLRKHLAEYEQLLDNFEEQDERASTAKEYFAVLYVLAPIHRAARNLHHALQQAREMVPDNKEIINMRDQAYQIERMAELLYADAKNSLDFIIAQRTEEQAESSYQMAMSSHRLNVLAAFFFPLATLSAIFGVNMFHGWEQENFDPNSKVPFVVMIGIGLIVGFLLKSFITRETPTKPNARSSKGTA